MRKGGDHNGSQEYIDGKGDDGGFIPEDLFA